MCVLAPPLLLPQTPARPAGGVSPQNGALTFLNQKMETGPTTLTQAQEDLLCERVGEFLASLPAPPSLRRAEGAAAAAGALRKRGGGGGSGSGGGGVGGGSSSHGAGCTTNNNRAATKPKPKQPQCSRPQPSTVAEAWDEMREAVGDRLLESERRALILRQRMRRWRAAAAELQRRLRAAAGSSSARARAPRARWCSAAAGPAGCTRR